MAGIAFGRLLLLLCHFGHPSEACMTKAGSCFGLDVADVVYDVHVMFAVGASFRSLFRCTSDCLKVEPAQTSEVNK